MQHCAIYSGAGSSATIIARDINRVARVSCVFKEFLNQKNNVLAYCFCRSLFLINLVLRRAHTRGHVAGTRSGDMLQRQFSSCDIPVLAKKFCCGARILSLQTCCMKFSWFESVRHEAGPNEPNLQNYVASCALLLQTVSYKLEGANGGTQLSVN